MNEYEVSFFAPQDGGLAMDIHNSTGTSPVATFNSVGDVRRFFSSLGIQEDRLAEIEKICCGLTPQHIYHERMFLPPSVIEAMERLTARADGAGHVPILANGSGAARDARGV